MRPKYNPRPKEMSVSIGLHLASIGAINFARKDDGNVIMATVAGVEYPSIEITFRVGQDKIKHVFSTTPTTQWIWDNLSRALVIDNTGGESISAAEAKGKMLFILVAGKAELDGTGRVKKNPDGTVYFDKQLRMKFWPFIEGAFKPALTGDPENNGGIPSGDFLLNDGLDLKQLLAIESRIDIPRPLPGRMGEYPLPLAEVSKYPIKDGKPVINEAEQRWIDDEARKLKGTLFHQQAKQPLSGSRVIDRNDEF